MKEDILSNPCWERLKRVIRYSGLSTNAFARAIGLKRGENLYQIKKGNHGISRELAERIHKYYPLFSVEWLLLGDKAQSPVEGSEEPPLGITVQPSPVATLPFYRSLTEREGAFPLVPDCFLHLSECLCNGALLATSYRKADMYPLLPNSCIVLLQPCSSEEIMDGGLYYIETKDFRLFRIVRLPGDGSSLLLLTTPSEDAGLEIERILIQVCMKVVGRIEGIARE